MKKRVLLMVALILLSAAAVHAETDLSRLNRLEGVSLYKDQDEARVVIRFAKSRELKLKPKFFERSIQLDIPGAYINPSKRVFELGGSLVRSAAAYQIKPDIVRLRLFTTEDAREYARMWKGSVNGDLMIMSIKRKPATISLPSIIKEDLKADKSILAKSFKKDAAKEQVPSSENMALPPVPEKYDWITKAKKPEKESKADLLSKTVSTIKNGNFLLSAGLKKDKGSKKSVGDKSKSGFLNYKSPEIPEAPSVGSMMIKMVSALSFTLAVVFLLAWAGKKYMGKINGAFGTNSLINVLATSSIDVKKRIAVVDVGGEVLILGVSGENITMLSSINDQEKADMFRRSGSGRSGQATSARVDSWINKGESPRDLGKYIKKALGFLRIGKIKTSRSNLNSLFDKSDPDTFAGSMAIAETDALSMKDTVSLGESISSRNDPGFKRKELVRKVTDAIKSKNNKLKLA